MTDNDFFEAVEIIEMELLDDCAHGELTRKEIQLFKKNFLNISREESYRFAAAFKRKIDATNQKIVGISVRTFFSPTRLLFAFASLLTIVIGFVVYFADQLHRERELTARLSHQLENSQLQRTAGNLQDKLQIAYLAHPDGRERGTNDVTWTSGVRALQFVVPVPKGFKGEASVGLENDAGRRLASLSMVFPQDIGQEHVLMATFPVDYFPTGNYFLILGADENKPSGSYVNGKKYFLRIHHQ